MMKLFPAVAALVFSATLAPPGFSAPWGPRGHSEITYDSAIGQFQLPTEIAKVMALGSLAPDYFEFDVPAAHAQTEDPPIEHNRLTISKNGYRGLQRKAYIDSFKWHDFYFKAAVAAMNHGQRERAAFLLGYALHNTQDLATHQGMPNLVHAFLDAGGASPDFEKNRLALSHAAAAVDIAAFREQIGAENWQLFQGRAVRRSNLHTIVPEPISVFATELDRWDPRSGILPPPADASWLTNPNRALLEAAFKQAAIDSYKPPVTGLVVDGKLPKFYNFLEGLLPRQEKMLKLIHLGEEDLAKLGLVRQSGDPWEPDLKGVVELTRYARQAWDFEHNAPKQFSALSAEDRKLLSSTNWYEAASELRREKLDRTAAARTRLIAAYDNRLKGLSTAAHNSEETLRWIAWQRAQFKEYEARWAAHYRVRKTIRMPTVDARPRTRSDDSEPSASSETGTTSRTESRSSRSERERSSGINFNSPTYNSLKSGSIRFR